MGKKNTKMQADFVKLPNTAPKTDTKPQFFLGYKLGFRCLTALLTVQGTRLKDSRTIDKTKGYTKFFDDDSVSHYFYRKGWLPIFSTRA
jgi:hypothetical protein